MIITKKHLSRRTFLRGALGTTLGLPLLDAMVPSLSAQSRTAAAPQFRFGAIYTPNGMCPGMWEPAGDAAELQLSPILTPFAAVRDRMVVVSNLYQSSPGDAHLSGCAMWLNGVFPKKTEGADVAAGVTIDQHIAAEIGRTTLLPSLQVGIEDMGSSVGQCSTGYSCIYSNTMSWRTPTAPLPIEINPRVVFERLFGETGTRAQRVAVLGGKRSILDAVTEDAANLQRRLGPRDRTRISEYLENVRQVEQRIQRAEQQLDSNVVVPDAPSGIPDTYDEHLNTLLDLVFIAFQADLTRVVTFMIGHAGSDLTYPQIGISESHHTCSHHGDGAEMMAKYTKINVYHATLVAAFMEKLQATPDGDGSLLDHSLFMYGSGMSNGNVHDRTHLPISLIGGAAGRVKGGRHIVESARSPLSNLLVSLGETAGVKPDALANFGESNGRVSL